jgi:hypothetical protein
MNEHRGNHCPLVLHIVIACLLIFGFFPLSLPSVSGATGAMVTLQVDTTVDDLTLQTCNDIIDDDCSLRGAIAQANADLLGNGYHIDIPIGVYMLNLNSGNPTEDANASGDLDILNTAVQLHGESMLQTIIDGNLTDRVIDHLASSGLLNVSNLTIRNGHLGSGKGGGGGIHVGPGNTLVTSYVRVTGNQVTCLNENNDNGGGIFGSNLATLTIANSEITENCACNGGGIRATNNTLSIQNTNFVDNVADIPVTTFMGSSGGGVSIANGGTITIERSTFDGNSADRGGGLFNSGSAFLTIRESSISQNEAEDGAGVFLYGTSTLTNVSIYNNIAVDDGGGIAMQGQVTMENVTIAGNTAAYGGGIELMGSAESILHLDHVSFASNTASSLNSHAIYAGADSQTTVTNTILDSSSGISTCLINFGATWTSTGYNISNDNSCQLSLTNDWVNTNPLLGTLGDYGGLTLTLPLLPGSPAIDHGNPGDPTDRLDQRGIAIMGGRSDIGAYEYYPLVLYLPIVLR